jgi:hypothetical protein
MERKPTLRENLTDIEVISFVEDAWLSLNQLRGDTKRGNETLRAARISLFALIIGLKTAMSEAMDHNPVIVDLDGSSPGHEAKSDGNREERP